MCHYITNEDVSLVLLEITYCVSLFSISEIQNKCNESASAFVNYYQHNSPRRASESYFTCPASALFLPALPFHSLSGSRS